MASQLHQTSAEDGPNELQYDLIKAITNNFDEERILPRAGLGTVYKGIYENGEEVAVKVLRNVSGFNRKEFRKEYQYLARLKHQNLVKMVGYSNESENAAAQQVIAEKMNLALCLEYPPNGSLANHISDPYSGLDWHTRYKIIKGTCAGLEYLRHGLEIWVWHLCLDTENIWLDHNMQPKISDINMTRLLDEDINTLPTREYLPPEYIEHGLITKGFDIFSLGVIITKVMTGPEGYLKIHDMPDGKFIQHVHNNWRERLNKTLGHISLEAHCNQVNACIQIALKCMSLDRQERPNIRDIVSRLIQTEILISDIGLQAEKDNDPRIRDEPRMMTYELLKQITNTFADDRKLGSGTFGDVYKGVHTDGQVIAVKMLRFMPGIDEKQFKNEFEHLKKLKHENIVKLIGFCNEEEKVLVYQGGKTINAVEIYRALCLEFVPNGGLGKFILEPHIGLDWPLRFRIIKGICAGLKYLHDVHVTHLDLKPDNILLDEQMLPKIADFGLSRLIGSENTYKMTLSPLGTIGYLPPEFIKKQVISLKYDIFSLGVIIKKTVAGIFDYSSICDMDDLECVEHVYQSWRKRLQEAPMYSSVEVDCKQVRVCIEIAMLCMKTDPRERPTMTYIVSELNNLESKDNDSPVERTNANMPGEASELETLDRIFVDATAEPIKLSYSLLQSITTNFTKVIGRGQYGVVYLGALPSGKVAVKKLSILQGFSDQQLIDVINCLLRARHNNVLRFLGYCADTQGELLKIDGKYVMAEVRQRILCFEYVPSGSLQHYLTEKDHVDEWPIRYSIIKGVCHGLHYLHKERIIHLDLKPENILLDARMEPKLTDFGLSRCFDEGESRIVTKIVHGIRIYMAPESIDNGEITFKTDVYSLGIIIIKLIVGHNYFDFEHWDKSVHVDSPEMKICIDIARSCVDIDQHKRPTVGNIIRLFNERESLMHEVSPAVLDLRNDPVSISQLNIHPLELFIPFDQKKSISFWLQLNNNGNDLVAFMLRAKSPKRYSTKLPLCGVVPPRCTYTITLTTRKQQQPPMDSGEYFTMHTCTVGEYELRHIDPSFPAVEYDRFFKKSRDTVGDEVQVVTLPVTCELPLVANATSVQPDQPGIMLMIEKLISLCGVSFLKKANETATDACDSPAGEEASTASQSTLEITATPSSRQVLSIDVHPTEPWILTTHQGGSLRVWNYHTMATMNSFQVTDEPVNAAKFIAREKWILFGDGDGYFHVYDYDVNEEVMSLVAHDSAITTLAVHPTQPLVLSTCHDDYLLKLWDWEKDWECTRTFQGHTGRVTQITFNPNGDPYGFTSASMDGRLMTWSGYTEECSFSTVVGYKEGLLCVDYFTRHGRQHLIAGSTDGTANIWNLGMEALVHQFEEHTGSISAINLHPELPFLITGSCDGTIRLWDSNTYKLENIISFNLGEVYAFGFIKGSTRMVVGCHEGICKLDLSSP